MGGNLRGRLQAPDLLSPEDIDPYGEAHNGPIVGHTLIAANSAATTGKEFKGVGAKRSLSTPRDSGGKFPKTQRTSNTETFSKRTSSTSYSTPTPDIKGKPEERPSVPAVGNRTPTTIIEIAPRTSVFVAIPLPLSNSSVSITTIILRMLSLPNLSRRPSPESWMLTNVDQPEEPLPPPTIRPQPKATPRIPW